MFVVPGKGAKLDVYLAASIYIIATLCLGILISTLARTQFQAMQMAFFLFHDTDLGGGSDGIFLNSKPTVTVFGLEALTLENPTHIYFITVNTNVIVPPPE
jgi:ABC-type transport system involved in multi-copper enzyme maturation permease subunit